MCVQTLAFQMGEMNRHLISFGSPEKSLLSSLADDIYNEEKQDSTGMRANFSMESIDGMFGSDQEGGKNAADHLGTFANMGNNMFGDGESNDLTKLADTASNQFGNGPKRPQQTGNQYIDTFNDYNTRLGDYLSTSDVADQAGMGGANPLSGLGSTLSPYQQQASEYGYKASQMYDNGQLNPSGLLGGL